MSRCWTLLVIRAQHHVVGSYSLRRTVYCGCISMLSTEDGIYKHEFSE